MMTRIHVLLFVAASILLKSQALAAPRIERGNLVFDNVPEASIELSDKLQPYLESRQAVPLGFSPKGALLIATRFGDVEQLHWVEQPGAERRQLTFFKEPVEWAAVSPDPGRTAFVYLKNGAGGEKAQLFYQRVGEAGAKLLSDGKSMNGSPVWSNAGREVAFFSTARDGTDVDIYIVDPQSGTLPRLAFSGDAQAASVLDWSPDDRKLLVLKRVSRAESYLYVVDLNSGQKREVEPVSSKVAIRGARFSRDGQGVYLISDRDSEFAQLRYVSLFTSEKSVISNHINADIDELALSRDGHYLAFVSNDGGLSKLNVLDLKTHQDLTPPKLPGAGVIRSLGFDADGKRLAFGLTAANQPEDAYVLDMASNHTEPWTRSEAGPVELTKFVIPRLTQFPSFDRTDGRPRQIPAYVYEPVAPGPHPVLIVLHGDAQPQFRPVFDPWLAYVVNELGFAVVAPNLRGSQGYGKTYMALGAGALDDAVKDLGALLVWIGVQANFDAKHVVVSGAGLGGSLALSAVANYSERLRGGVDLSGISDFVTFLSNSAPYQLGARRAEYGDERDPETRAYLRRISPLANAERITRPVYIAHGKNDAEVPSSEADQIVNRLRVRGGEVWFLQANDEGHEIKKKQNRDVFYRIFAQFLIAQRQ